MSSQREQDYSLVIVVSHSSLSRDIVRSSLTAVDVKMDKFQS
jgi:hypothetical protein